MPAHEVIDWLSSESGFCSQLSTLNDDLLEMVSRPNIFLTSVVHFRLLQVRKPNCQAYHEGHLPACVVHTLLQIFECLHPIPGIKCKESQERPREREVSNQR